MSVGHFLWVGLLPVAAPFDCDLSNAKLLVIGDEK